MKLKLPKKPLGALRRRKPRLSASEKAERAIARRGYKAISQMPRGKRRYTPEDYIRAFFMASMPAAVKEQLRGAKWDLYEGPMSKEDARAQGIRGWRGFAHAAKVLGDWADKTIQSVWFDDDSDNLLLSEPEGYEGDDGEWFDAEPATPYRDHEVREAVFGYELAKAIA